MKWLPYISITDKTYSSKNVTLISLEHVSYVRRESVSDQTAVCVFDNGHQMNTGITIEEFLKAWEKHQ